MAVKLIEETNVLTLDFWEENVFYEGKEFPAGTLACHALNIPDEVISQMETLCNNLNTFMGTFNAGKANPALLPAARQSALRLFALMMEHKPFSCINADVFKGMIEKAFTANSVKITNAFIQAQRSGKLTDQLESRYQDGILLCRLLPVLAHLGYSLKEFKKTMIPFAEKIHEAEKRIDVTYAEIFQQYFPKDPTFEDAGGWMSMTNVTQQYLTILHPQKETPLLVKRMHYVSFVGMLRGDYFEGLRNGNGPKKCKNCGRWFLTTNAYLIKYCDNKVPDNWCFFYFTSLIDIEGGTQPPKSQFIDEPRDGYARLIQIRDFATDKYTVYVPDTPKMRHLEEKDILIARYGASLGRICTGQKGVYNVALVKTIFSESALNRKYVYWMLQSETFQNPLTQLSRTAQAGFNKDDLSGFAMPLAPLAEQQRIVDRIEYLFAKLDEAKEKAQSVLDSFESRKAAILHKAFIGALTAKWRVDNSASDPWHTKKLSDVANLQTGLMKGKRFEGSTLFMPYLRVANVQDGYLALDEIKEIEVGVTGFERYLLHNGDVLFTEGGDYDKLGRGTVWRDEIPNCLHQNHIFVVRVDARMLVPEFLSYQAGSRYGKKYFLSCAKQTTNLASLNSTQLKNFPVLLPTVAEQTEIVRILDSLLAKEQQAKEAAEAVLEKIDLLKKSILARAFRGELGTNAPTEESALELLKEAIR